MESTEKKKNQRAMSRYHESESKLYHPSRESGFTLSRPEQINLAVYNVAEIRGFFTRYLPDITHRMTLKKIPFDKQLEFESNYRPSKIKKATVHKYIEMMLKWLPDLFYYKSAESESSESDLSSSEDEYITKSKGNKRY